MWPARNVTGVLLFVTAWLAAAVPAGGQASAQAPVEAAPAVRASLQRLDAVLSAIPDESSSVVTARQRAQVILRDLLTLSTSWPADSPAPYRRSVATLVRRLEQAARDAGPSLPTVLDALADDLSAKLEHCRASGGKLGGSVKVRVRTVQGQREAPRWQVYYMAKILEASPGATPDVFPVLSSPTEELIVPGRYVIWGREPATGFIGARLVVKVGEGRANLDLELPVPSPPP